MTAEELRKLDAEIAEKVFGFKWYVYGCSRQAHLEDPKRVGDCVLYKPWDGAPKAFDTINVPHYSTDIAAAWEVVEKMRGAGLRVVIETAFVGVSFVRVSMVGMNHVNVGEEVRGDEGGAPLAICRAALRCVK